MDWPTTLVASPVRFTELAPPEPGAPMQVLWYSAAREADRFTVRNWQGELLADDTNWTALCERLGWTSVAVPGEQVVAGDDRRHVAPQTGSAQSGRATRLDPSSPTVPEQRAVSFNPQRAEAGPASPVAAAVPPRPPVGRTAVADGIVDRRDRDYGRPISYYLYSTAGELVCMSHSWSWLCHIRGWAAMPGLDPGQRIPAGFPNAYDTLDEAADLAAIAAWDPARPPSSAKAGDEQTSHLRATGRSDGENGAASRDARPLAKEGSSSSLETRRDESGPSRSPPASSPAEADPQIGLFG